MIDIQRAAQRAIQVASELITIDSSNYGDGSGPLEREAGDYVLDFLSQLDVEVWCRESVARRPNIVVRVPGERGDKGALVVHGHLDVVPASAAEWTHPPFSGLIEEGMLWGRGAVDMKDMDAMMLSVLAELVTTGVRPRRDLIFAFFSDEEAGGVYGAHWVADNHPEVFAGATHAISEVGGFSVDIAGRRAYLIQTAEKGLAWLRLVASGRAGHGSAVNPDNAVTALAGAVERIGNHPWPLCLTPTVVQLLSGVARLTGLRLDLEDPQAIDALLQALGAARRFVGSSVRTLATPTGLQAGYKANVVPSTASATVDMRFVPGGRDEAYATLRELAGPGIELEVIHEDVSVESAWDDDLVGAMDRCVRAADPDAVTLPYLLSAGTDNKALSTLGIAGYGFTPLRLPAAFDFTAMFHGVDERVPLSAIEFGTKVLADFLTTS